MLLMKKYTEIKKKAAWLIVILLAVANLLYAQSGFNQNISQVNMEMNKDNFTEAIITLHSGNNSTLQTYRLINGFLDICPHIHSK